MKISDVIRKRLDDDYLLGGDVLDEIMGAAKTDKLLEPMQDRWEEQAETYPPILITSVMLNVKRVALKYLKANYPQCFQIGLLEE